MREKCCPRATYNHFNWQDLLLDPNDSARIEYKHPWQWPAFLTVSCSARQLSFLWWSGITVSILLCIHFKHWDEVKLLLSIKKTMDSPGLFCSMVRSPGQGLRVKGTYHIWSGNDWEAINRCISLLLMFLSLFPLFPSTPSKIQWKKYPHS